jgi:hypothetical protein
MAFAELAADDALLAAALQQQQQQQGLGAGLSATAGLGGTGSVFGGCSSSPLQPSAMPGQSSAAAAAAAQCAGVSPASPGVLAFGGAAASVQQALQNLHCSIASSQQAAAQQLLANLNLAFELQQQSAEAADAALRVQAVQLAAAQQLAQQLQVKLHLVEQQVQQEVQQRLNQEAAAAAAQQALREAQEKVEQATLCQICFEQPRDTVLMPCMHFLYCAGCVRKGVEQAAAGKDGGVLRCPVCRAPVSGQVVVHLSPG